MLIIGIIVLIFSVIIHEISHGYVANSLGDPTARLAGRLTLNPISHIDPIGSIVVPLITWFSGGFVFGWAKPVPYNPYNLKAGRWSEAYVALAGPASNILLAIIFGLLIRFGGGMISQSMLSVFALIVMTNLALAIFNLVPIPPLDGSKILFALLPYQYSRIRFLLERYGFVLVLVFVIFLWQILSPVIGSLFYLLTGL